MCSFSKLLLFSFFFSKDGSDQLMKRASYSCCNFLCVVLAAAYLKYRRCRLVVPAIRLALFFIVTHPRARTHAHIHAHARTHPQPRAHMFCIPQHEWHNILDLVSTLADAFRQETFQTLTPHSRAALRPMPAGKYTQLPSAADGEIAGRKKNGKKHTIIAPNRQVSECLSHQETHTWLYRSAVLKNKEEQRCKYTLKYSMQRKKRYWPHANFQRALRHQNFTSCGDFLVKVQSQNSNGETIKQTAKKKKKEKKGTYGDMWRWWRQTDAYLWPVLSKKRQEQVIAPDTHLPHPNFSARLPVWPSSCWDLRLSPLGPFINYWIAWLAWIFWKVRIH